MARRIHYNYYDDDFKATAVALTEIPGVVAKYVTEALYIHEVKIVGCVLNCQAQYQMCSSHAQCIQT